MLVVNNSTLHVYVTFFLVTESHLDLRAVLLRANKILAGYNNRLVVRALHRSEMRLDRANFWGIVVLESVVFAQRQDRLPCLLIPR